MRFHFMVSHLVPAHSSVDKCHEVSQLVGKFVQNERRSNRPSDGRAAPEKRRSDGDAVREVADKISCDHSPTYRLQVTEIQQTPLLACFHRVEETVLAGFRLKLFSVVRVRVTGLDECVHNDAEGDASKSSNTSMITQGVEVVRIGRLETLHRLWDDMK